MVSPQILNIDELLQPIAGDQPQGQDLRADSSPSSPYYQIKDARGAARAAERASLFDPEEAGNVLGAWQPILELAPGVLQEQAKDLEVASWLVEALLRRHGHPGLRDGFALLQGLVDQFWDGLYPEPDEDGIETKVAPLAGLNGDSGEGTLLAPMRNAPITPQTSFGEFSYWQYQQARDASKINDLEQREEKEASLGFNLSAIEAAVAEASADFYPNLVEDLEQAAADFKAMNERLREHCGHDAPPYTLVLDTLEEILRAVRFLAKDKLAAAAPEPQEETMVETGTSAGGSPAPTVTTAGGSGPIASREEALRRLEEVARYFRATEPHTPLVTGIERLVRWGRMPMNELILELVPDPTARAFYQHLTGAKLSAGEEDATQAYQATAGTSSENNNTGTATDDSNDNNDNGMSW
ncbi:MAG: type VI secretion system protein TssA [Pseudomonadota bacterium]|nr:type VI secretion system protein TssA [Pseudomonadales bacterium]MDY6919719.1 type VI secretion system protein TssA [Pseudomonadota bacterium]